MYHLKKIFMKDSMKKRICQWTNCFFLYAFYSLAYLLKGKRLTDKPGTAKMSMSAVFVLKQNQIQ